VPYVRVDDRRSQIVAAARTVLARDGVSGTTMRSLAAEAGIPLSSLHYAFQSKEQIFRAVLEDIIAEMSKHLELYRAGGAGLAQTLRLGLRRAFGQTMGTLDSQLLQYELTTYALRTAGLAGLAAWQYEQYSAILARWCQEAATEAGETCAVSFDALARVILAALDGLILQQLAGPDAARAAGDLDNVIEAVIALAGPRYGAAAAAAPPRPDGAP
jgi:AcrR family transcriptional regulator